MLPMRWRFYQSGLYISPLAPLLLGFVAGMLTVLLGVGGGFIVVPAMIYLLGMSAQVVVGTSLLQILFVTAATTLIHATTTKSVDIVLAGLLLLGSVIGAQFGARLAQKVEARAAAHVPRHHHPRGRAAHGARPRLAARGDLLGADAVRRASAAFAAAARAAGARAPSEPKLVPDVSQRDIEIRYSFTGAELLLFGAILYPGGRAPRERADIAVVVKGPVEPLVRAREAEGRRHLDECRERPLPLGAVLLRRRLVAAAVAS